MKTLHTHNLEIEKKFDEEFIKKSLVEMPKELRFFSSVTIAPDVLDFITNSHKQLYIKIAESEIERLNEDLWTKENCPISKMEYELQGVEFLRGKVEGHNQAIQDSINYWNNILQELNK